MTKRQAYVLIALAFVAAAGAMTLYGMDYWPIVLGIGIAALLSAIWDPRGNKGSKSDQNN